MKLSHSVFILSSFFTLSAQATDTLNLPAPVYKQLPQNTRKVLKEKLTLREQKSHTLPTFLYASTSRH